MQKYTVISNKNEKVGKIFQELPELYPDWTANLKFPKEYIVSYDYVASLEKCKEFCNKIYPECVFLPEKT